MSEQEWRDAIVGVISGPLPPSADPESHDHGLWLSNQRLADVLLAAVEPLRERERQQARQEERDRIDRAWFDANIRPSSYGAGGVS